MDKKAIDWRDTTNEERAILYPMAQRIMIERRWSLDEFFKQTTAEGPTRGTGYADNFRAGRIAARKADQIFCWCCDHEPQYAARIVEQVRSLRAKREGGRETSGWAALVSGLAHFSNIEVLREIPSRAPRDAGLDLTKPADREPAQGPLRLLERFCFRLEAPFPGAVTAFQDDADLWFPLFLSPEGPASVSRGQNILPVAADRQTPLMLWEEALTERRRFVFVLTENPLPEDIAGVLRPDHAIAPKLLDHIGDHIAALPASGRAVFRVNIRFAR